MSSAVREIERAIGELRSDELEELCAWFEQYHRSFDERIATDLSAGRLDRLIDKALEQERAGLVRPL
jgi:hypothetical protein